MRAIVFELEVLVDTDGAVREFVTSVLQRPVPSEALRPPAAEWLAHFHVILDGSATPWRPYAGRLADAYDLTMRHYALEIFTDDAPGLIRAVAHSPTVAPSLVRRFAKKFRLALIAALDADLLAEPLGRLQAPFSSVVAGDDARSGDPLRLALDRLALPPAEVLFVTTRARDVKIRTALVGNRDGTADLRAPTLEALAQALGL